jgi:hypothetical protein
MQDAASSNIPLRIPVDFFVISFFSFHLNLESLYFKEANDNESLHNFKTPIGITTETTKKPEQHISFSLHEMM